MRILFCCSESPRAPLNGARLVAWHLSARLTHRHDVTVISVRHPDQTGAPPPGVRMREVPLPPLGRAGSWVARGAALTRREPVEARRMVASLDPLVRELAGHVDVAHVMLGELAGLARSLDVPTVIAPLDAWHRNVEARAAITNGPAKLWRHAQARAVRRLESTEYQHFSRVVLVTEEDASALHALNPSLPTVVIPNGVDAGHYAPDGRARSGVLFTGALNYPPNEQAAVRLAERIMPLVRRSMPEAQLTLVGRSPGPRVRGLDATVIADAPDLRPYLWGAAVYACPMELGTGIKNKLLEAMAAGVPAVATPLACQGMVVANGIHLRIADDDAAFASALLETLRAPGDSAETARDYVRAHHDWDAVADAYEATYQEIIDAH